MANQYSEQYKKAHIDRIPSRLYAHEKTGRVRRLYAKVTLDAEVALADVVYMAKLPKDAVIVSSKLFSAGGSAGVVQVGFAATEKNAADLDALHAAVSSAAAISENMNVLAQEDAFNVRQPDEKDIVLTATTLTAGMTGKAVELEIEYIVD